MKKIQQLVKLITDSQYRFYILSRYGLFNQWPDEKFLKRKFKSVFGYELDLQHPQTFSEKLQWLKLHDRNPLYTTLVDKYAVKKWVADKIGEQYVIPTLGVWKSFDEIDFDKLPNQFVLKATHNSGGIAICTDKSTFNKQAARKKLNNSLAHNYYWHGREWAYKDVTPRIIAEKYMLDDKTNELRDYKFFCFNGVPKMLFIATDRQHPTEQTKFDFFDMDYKHLPFTNGHPNAKQMPQKPQNFEEMKKLAAVLSAGFPHVRVDFYEINGKVYFGEMTFFHWSGFMPFDPPEWDKEIGDWLVLP